MTVTKLQFPKQKSKLVSQRGYKKLCNKMFRAELDHGSLEHDMVYTI